GSAARQKEDSALEKDRDKENKADAAKREKEDKALAKAREQEDKTGKRAAPRSAKLTARLVEVLPAEAGAHFLRCGGVGSGVPGPCAGKKADNVKSAASHIASGGDAKSAVAHLM